MLLVLSLPLLLLIVGIQWTEDIDPVLVLSQKQLTMRFDLNIIPVYR
jgi:hypothetical protein